MYKDKTEYYEQLTAEMSINNLLKSKGLISNEEFEKEKRRITEQKLKGYARHKLCPNCKIPMKLYSDESQLYCAECGLYCSHCKILMEIYDYDETQFCCPQCGLFIQQDHSYISTPYGYISKPSKAVFHPIKHFSDKLNQILGGAIPKDPSVLTKIRQHCEQNNVSEITVGSLRTILKNLNLSKYYMYTSYFFTELTGITPPKISEEFLMRANFLFKQYIKMREKMRYENSSFGSNNPQYPYLIFKIFDAILPLHDIENRRMFQFIHLPSKATLLKRDEEWNIIWKHIK